MDSTQELDSVVWVYRGSGSVFSPHRACNAIFTALEQSQDAIEITSENQVIQVGSWQLLSVHMYFLKLVCDFSHISYIRV